MSDYEMSVLGSVLLDNKALPEIISALKADDFEDYKNQLIYGAMLKMHEAGDYIDLLTLNGTLKDNGNLDKVGGTPYLTRLLVPTTAGLQTYLREIKKASKKRKHESLFKLINAKIANGTDIDSAVNEFEEKLYELRQDGAIDSGDGINDGLNDIINEWGNPNIEINCIKTGFMEIDSKLLGLIAPDLIVLAARPSMGKTALALNFAMNAASHGKQVAIFSLEMSKTQLQKRLLSLESGINILTLNSKKNTDKTIPKVVKAAGVISDLPIYIYDAGGITINDIRSTYHQAKRKHGLDIIIVDYLQLMSGTGKEQTREQEIANISRGLKSLAKEFNIPILALSQLNRAIEQRTIKRPQLSDIRESGAIEQDADIVCFIHREEVYNYNSDKKGIAEIIIAKNRNGPTGMIELAFLKETMRFGDLQNINESKEDL